MTADAAGPAGEGIVVFVCYRDGLEVRESFAGPRAVAAAAPYLEHVLRLPEPVGVWLTREAGGDPAGEFELGCHRHAGIPPADRSPVTLPVELSSSEPKTSRAWTMDAAAVYRVAAAATEKWPGSSAAVASDWVAGTPPVPQAPSRVRPGTR